MLILLPLWTQASFPFKQSALSPVRGEGEAAKNIPLESALTKPISQKETRHVVTVPGFVRITSWRLSS